MQGIYVQLQTIEQIKKIKIQRKGVISKIFGILSGMQDKALIFGISPEFPGWMGHPSAKAAIPFKHQLKYPLFKELPAVILETLHHHGLDVFI